MRIPTVFHESGLRGRAVRSAALTMVDFASQYVLRLGGNLILTRILFPEAFGIMALITVVTTGLQMFSDVGIRLSIIQNPRGDDPLFLDTAWMIQIFRGVVLWFVTWVLASPVALFYDAAILADLLPVAGLMALIQGFTSTKLVTANRKLILGRVTLIVVLSRLFGLIVLIGLALWLESVWALVLGGLIGPFCIMVCSHLFIPGRMNRFRFDVSASAELIRFGKYIFLSTVAGFLVTQADRAILGKFVSLEELALYGIAIMFATVPRQAQVQLLDKVLLPLYSQRPPHESAQNFRNIARARLMVLTAAVAGASVLALFGDTIIRWLYDPRYEAAGVLLVLSALASLPGLVIGGYGHMIVSRGHSGRYAAFITTAAVLRTGLLLVAVMKFGAIGAALAPLVATLLFYPFMLWFIWPYKGWVPLLDLIFGGISLVVGGLAIWLNQDAIRAGLAVFMPS